MRKLLASLLIAVTAATAVPAPTAAATTKAANASHTYVFNDQASHWAIGAKVDYFNGQISIAPGTWSYWSPVTVPVVNTVFNGIGSCLKVWWLDASGWHYYGQVRAQNVWVTVPHQFESVGITALPWDGRAVC